MSCHCEHPHRCWSWSEPYPAYSWGAAPGRDEYAHRLQDEQALLQQRLRRLEQELEELRRARQPAVTES
jgi:hypothetical protein